MFLLVFPLLLKLRYLTLRLVIVALLDETKLLSMYCLESDAFFCLEACKDWRSWSAPLRYPE